jgi:alpha-tubulin suppressor-like RCC1 family protein
MRPITRREALSLMAVLPLAARLRAQTRPGPDHRVVLGMHCLMLEPGGTVKVWRTQIAQDSFLLPGKPLPAYTLADIPGLANVVNGAVGPSCSFVVLNDGRLLAWGLNSNGMLGTTPLSQFEVLASWAPHSMTPAPVATRFDAADVSCGSSHVLALARDGSVYAWGTGKSGQLGIGPMPTITFRTRTASATTYIPFPARVPDLANAVAVSAGYSHSLALLGDGTIRAWGWNKTGELGDGSTTSRDRPVQVQGVRNAVAISAGGMFSVAALSDGTVVTWGADCTGVDPRPVLIPRPVPGVRDVTAIASGYGHVVALTRAGTLMTWGDNTHYGIGRGRNASQTPGVVQGLGGVRSIAAYDDTSVAVLSSGRIMTWGEVRPWNRPDGGRDLSPLPILLWVDGLDQS